MKNVILFLVTMMSMEIPVFAVAIPSGKVQASDAKAFDVSGEAFIRDGMSYSEVVRLLGGDAVRHDFMDLAGSASDTYCWYDGTHFAVVGFMDDKVVTYKFGGGGFSIRVK